MTIAIAQTGEVEIENGGHAQVSVFLLENYDQAQENFSLKFVGMRK